METSNFKKLIARVLECSTNEDWSIAKTEWECTEVYEGVNNCECGKKILHNYIIKNKHNSNELVVGSTCVNKFGDKNMDNFVKVKEDERKAVDKEKKSYEKLKAKQLSGNIPISITKAQLNKAHTNKIVNDFELTFYNDVYDYAKLSPKQIALKQKINDKLK
jgi:hypothetical protein